MTPTKQHQAFTLMELMVAIALAGIISAATTSAFMGLYRAQKRLEQQAEADQEAKFLLDVLLSRAQQAGGEQVRPWDALVVENSCSGTTIGGVTLPGCGGTDRVHLLRLDTTVAQAQLLTGPPHGVAGSNFRGTGTGSTCSLSAMSDRFGVLVAKTGEMRPAQCTSLTVSSGNCMCTDPGSASGFRNDGAVAGTDFDGGVFAVGFVETYYVENGVLKVLTDKDGDGTAEVEELADRVADFQVDFGFDTDANFSVDGFSAVVDAGHPKTSMRMVRAGIMLDVPAPARDVKSTAQLIGGAIKTKPRGSYLYATQAKVVLRNLDLFF